METIIQFDGALRETAEKGAVVRRGPRASVEESHASAREAALAAPAPANEPMETEHFSP